MVTLPWCGVILRASVPLAILGGCQTLTMLTGGIDLSVATVASMAGFVTATFVHSPGGWVQGMAIALAAAALAGLVTGIGVGVFRVHPLIMTLAMSFVVLGFANVWQLQTVQTGAGVPGRAEVDREQPPLRCHPLQPPGLRPADPVDTARPAADRVRPAVVRHRRQPRRRSPVGRPFAAGPDRPIRDLARFSRPSPGSSSRASPTPPACHSPIHTCYRPSRRRSLAGPRSWAAAADSEARSSARSS